MDKMSSLSPLDKAPRLQLPNIQMDSPSNDKTQSPNDNTRPQDNGRRKFSSLPPPHPVTPPPQKEDISKLLSPWWAEEPPSARPLKKKGIYSIHNFSRTSATQEAANAQVSGQKKPAWKENCLLLTKREGKPKSNALKHQFGEECSMICFLQQEKQIRKSRVNSSATAANWSPFYGSWIIFASSRTRCLEHIEGKKLLYIAKKSYIKEMITLAKEIVKKDMPDYRVIHLGEYFEQSGEDAKQLIEKTFTPLQELTAQYMESWRNGSQTAFFARFWEGAKRGDAFLLVRDGTRRMIENAFRFTKTDGDHSDRKK
ncbi:hypothetical protein EC973_009027 [Apophysomyces ossiformis]|uniref:Uncharacterized protein n=1 Tax=Apophysomyces ossiformis TaxID=679940 RepID=A0A8H7BSK0_9FUNG|nr:hypothetical protein EC973_009027 [Apophysomyces ossiformis]